MAALTALKSRNDDFGMATPMLVIGLLRNDWTVQEVEPPPCSILSPKPRHSLDPRTCRSRQVRLSASFNYGFCCLDNRVPIQFSRNSTRAARLDRFAVPP